MHPPAVFLSGRGELPDHDYPGAKSWISRERDASVVRGPPKRLPNGGDWNVGAWEMPPGGDPDKPANISIIYYCFCNFAAPDGDEVWQSIRGRWHTLFGASKFFAIFLFYI